ncbi:hypothetical protein Adi01nite_15850 [Amorphoplanes digitatis]|nr:hypothetical protein GCM10020092_057340 [Actinoplanes digitatis]GID92173.1 hypothetical protein Adi01nite_15850 [Actinoplanes digitatis]
MSYDPAVWEGDRPADDAAALTHFGTLYKKYIGGKGIPPSARRALG